MERIWFGASRTPKGEVQYYLLKETCGEGSAYGILVALEYESAEILRITVRFSEIQQLLQAMLRGTVTPVTVRDIVEDWLAR